MTALTHCVLRCDVDWCDARFTSAEARHTPTRAAAAVVGWVHGVVRPAPNRGGPSVDFCPEHADHVARVGAVAVAAVGRAE